MQRRFGRFGDATGAPVPQQAPGNLPTDQYGPYSKQDRFWFTYQTPNIASLAAAASATNSIVFDNDSAFEWTKTTYTVDKANQIQGLSGSGGAVGAVGSQFGIVAPYVTLQIQDTGQGSYYSNAAIPVWIIAGGQSGLPYVMPAPQIISPNATIAFNWVSFSTAGGGNETYTNLRLQLHGWKIRR
jgi:hypothetical protein